MNTSRLFIAVPIAPEIKQGISEFSEQWKPKTSFQKWVHPDDLHITLKFIGSTDDSKIEEIVRRVREVSQSCADFALAVKGIGTFGRPGAPQILWAGVGGATDRLKSLQTAIESEMIPLGYAAENRAYSPHVTIARKYAGSVKFDRAMLESMTERFLEMEWNVKHIAVYKTHMNRAPMYEEIARESLSSSS
jgi:2'-5' RNA ligase